MRVECSSAEDLEKSKLFGCFFPSLAAFRPSLIFLISSPADPPAQPSILLKRLLMCFADSTGVAQTFRRLEAWPSISSNGTQQKIPSESPFVSSRSSSIEIYELGF